MGMHRKEPRTVLVIDSGSFHNGSGQPSSTMRLDPYSLMRHNW